MAGTGGADIRDAWIPGDLASIERLWLEYLSWGNDEMATDAARQRSGVGRRLLTTAMAEARIQGAARFFLGATPAGFRLSESLGFATRTTAAVWAYGETHQA